MESKPPLLPKLIGVALLQFKTVKVPVQVPTLGANVNDPPPDRSIAELLPKCNVPLVVLLFPLLKRVPPLSTMDVFGRTFGAPSRTPPLLIVVAPLKVLAAEERVTVPKPVFVREPLVIPPDKIESEPPARLAAPRSTWMV